MRVLAVGAHFDDVEIGCGGSLAKHVDAGDHVAIFVATHSGYSSVDGTPMRDSQVAKAEGEIAAAHLGVSEVHCADFPTNGLLCNEALVIAIRRLVDAFKPDLVYCHWLEDVHLDHHNLARATLSACRHVPSFLCYQSNLYPAASTFSGRLIRDISLTFTRKKAACLAFESELSRGLLPLVEEILAQNTSQAAKFGLAAVECFEVLRFVAD